MSDQLQIDIACAVLRIEQAYAERGNALGELLLERLQGDARRLRGHLAPTWLAAVAAETGPTLGCPSCHTILNAKRAGCGDPWHADNRPASGGVVESSPLTAEEAK